MDYKHHFICYKVSLLSSGRQRLLVFYCCLVIFSRMTQLFSTSSYKCLQSCNIIFESPHVSFNKKHIPQRKCMVQLGDVIFKVGSVYLSDKISKALSLLEEKVNCFRISFGLTSTIRGARTFNASNLSLSKENKARSFAHCLLSK